METNQESCCPICNKQPCFYYREVYDDRYGYPGSFNLFKCKNCGHIFLNAKLSEELLTNLYTNYYPRAELDIKKIIPIYEAKGFSSWLKGKQSSAYTYVPPNVRILDIGCGFGETLAYHKNRGCDVFGSEVDKNVSSSAKKFNLDIRIGTYNSNNYEKDFFDYITMDQLIEHIEDPIDFLKGIYENLKKGGIAIISTPNANGWGAKWYKNQWLHWHTPYHLHFFSKTSLKVAAQKANLQITNIRYATLSDWLYWQWIHLIFRPEINKPNLFWKYMNNKYYSNYQVERFNKIEKIKRTRINDLITRIFDFLHLGDNYVFILRKADNE